MPPKSRRTVPKEHHPGLIGFAHTYTHRFTRVREHADMRIHMCIHTYLDREKKRETDRDRGTERTV